MKRLFSYLLITLGVVGSVCAIVKGFNQPEYFIQLLIYVPIIVFGRYIINN